MQNVYIYIYIYIHSEYIIQNAGLYKSQAGRLPGEISVTSDMQVTPLIGRKRRGTKETPDEGQRGE